MDILLITHDYPYGMGETFLEAEIKYLSEAFSAVFIISTSRNINQTRNVPSNVIVRKCLRYYHPILCALYAMRKLFSKEFCQEIYDTKNISHRPSFFCYVRNCFRSWSIEHRLDLFVSSLHLETENMIGYSYWLAESAYFLAKHKEKFKACVSRVHGYEIRDFELYLPFRKQVNNNLDAFFFISIYSKNAYCDIISRIKRVTNNSNKFVFHLGVPFCPTIIDKEEMTKKEEVIIVSASSIYSLKRLDLIIEALHNYQGEKLIHWVHFGWGELGSAMYELCKTKLESKSNVSYEFKGQVSNAQILSYYQNNNIDLFINTSDYEGIPVSIMEAMSFGIPCMARNVGGNSEIVINNKTGYLLDSSPNIDQILKVFAIIADGTNRIKATNVWENAKDSFDASENYQKFCNFLLCNILRS